MRNILMIATILLQCNLSFSQNFKIDWEKTYGDTTETNEGSTAYSICQTQDGGYIIGGTNSNVGGDITVNHGSLDCWVIKINETGKIVWQKSYGGAFIDDLRSIIQTTDGGYIFAGTTTSSCQDCSADGNVAYNHDEGLHASSDVWVVKLNSNGDITWQKSLGGAGNEIGNSIQQTTDGGYIIAAYSNSGDGDVTGNHGGQYFGQGGGDFWVVKLASNGSIEWQKSLGGTGNDEAFDAKQTPDGGYIIVGSITSNNGDVTHFHNDVGGGQDLEDIWVVSLSSKGEIKWQKDLGGSGQDLAYSVAVATDGYLVAGSTTSKDGDVSGLKDKNDCWIVKLNKTGDIMWQKPLGGTWYDYATSINPTSDGGFIISAVTESEDEDVKNILIDTDGLPLSGGENFWVVKIDKNGSITNERSLGGSDDDEAYCAIESKDGNYIVVGNSKSNDFDVKSNTSVRDAPIIWVAKLSSSGNAVSIAENSGIDTHAKIFPNPAKDYLSIKINEPAHIEMFSLNGVMVRSFEIQSSKNILLNGLSSGLYEIKVQTRNSVSVIPIIVR